MNIKNSKKIVPATVFAAIIVLLAFSVMSTTASESTDTDNLATTLFPVEGDLEDVVKVTIDVTNVNDVTQRVKVEDTLPAEFTYIGNFMVDRVPTNPTVDKQVISYNIINPDVEKTYKIEFNVKVTKDYWEHVTVTNRVEGTWYDANNDVIKTITDKAPFDIWTYKLVTKLDPVRGDLGDVVKVTIGGTVEAGLAVNVVDTLPAEFTYIGNFKVENVKGADPTVDEQPTVDKQVISYTIDNTAGASTVSYMIVFDVKVTKAHSDDVRVTNRVEGTWYDATNNEIKTKTAKAPFDIKAYKLVTNFDSREGNLGKVVNVRIAGTVEAGLAVKVVDTLPAEFTYKGNFKVENVKEANPTVDEQVISYTIDNTAGRTALPYKIAFDVKVTKAYLEDQEVENVVEGTWYDEDDNVLQTIRVTPEQEFNIKAFTDLHESVKGPTMEPVIGTVAAWEITMGVENNIVGYTMEDTKITEGFGGDLKIDFIKVGETTCTFKYDENYGTKNDATVDICCSNVDTCETVALGKTGLTQGGFHIYWTGRTHKAHFVWDIDDLKSSDRTGIITFGVSTDTNPQGKQEYTSTGIHKLNSGARLTFNDKAGMMHSAVAAPIEVTAVSSP